MNTSIYSCWHRRLRVQLNRIDPPTGGPPVYTLTLGDKILQLPGREMWELVADLYDGLLYEPFNPLPEAEPSTPWERAVDAERRTDEPRRKLRPRRCRSRFDDRRDSPPTPAQDRRQDDDVNYIGRRRGSGRRIGEV